MSTVLQAVTTLSLSAAICIGTGVPTYHYNNTIQNYRGLIKPKGREHRSHFAFKNYVRVKHTNC
jgi:hypothetical protein